LDDLNKDFVHIQAEIDALMDENSLLLTENAEQRSRIAVLEAVIEKAHGVLTDPPLRPATERVIKAVQELRTAPSTVLDQMIREAKAEAWDEGASDGQWNSEHEAMIERGNRDAIQNPYRNGDV
jgi:cell division septum initiation protein DivIVA